MPSTHVSKKNVNIIHKVLDNSLLYTVVKKRKLTVRKLQIYFSLDKWGNFCTIVL